MKTMKDYPDLCLKCDVSLLAHVEKFRNNSLKNYGLYAIYYMRAPALNLDVMLLWQKFSLNLDAELYLFFEKCMRDRVSYTFEAYSKANKKYLKSYGPKQKLKHCV